MNYKASSAQVILLSFLVVIMHPFNQDSSPVFVLGVPPCGDETSDSLDGYQRPNGPETQGGGGGSQTLPPLGRSSRSVQGLAEGAHGTSRSAIEDADQAGGSPLEPLPEPDVAARCSPPFGSRANALLERARVTLL